ncbi:MAG: phosphatase PAP2 family protein [Myxococcota bacterium]
MLDALVLTTVLLTGTEEQPPPQPPPTPARSERARRSRQAVEEALRDDQEETPPVVTTPPPARQPTALERAITSGPAHYAFYYAPDYISVAGLGALSLAVTFFPPPISRRAAFGPSYDPASRSTSEVYAREHDTLLGARFRPDTVPTWALVLVGNAGLLGGLGLGLAHRPSFRKLHHFLLGAAQAQLGTYLLTELTKNAAGRLRPDYRDRMARYYCAPGRDPPQGVDCTAVRAQAAREGDGVYIDEKEFNDGRRSFPSGHASNAFAVASYLALFFGGEFVWGEHASAVTRITGVMGQIAALTAALFVCGTRLTDGRHHPEDVAVGAGLGAALGAGAYFLHFDLKGNPMVRSVSLAPLSGEGSGIGLRGVF